jgi:hypothetical protein
MDARTLLAVPEATRTRLDLRLTRIDPLLIDDFEWNSGRWRLRFQSWVRKPQEVDPILEPLLDVFPEDHPDCSEPPVLPRDLNSSLPAKLGWLRRQVIVRAAVRQDKTGWHLKRVCDGVEGWFDLTHLPKESSEKQLFASFDLERDGVVYRCQFHILELCWPSEKPTSWDNSRGAKAGLPTLGKRR